MGVNRRTVVVILIALAIAVVPLAALRHVVPAQGAPPPVTFVTESTSPNLPIELDGNCLLPSGAQTWTMHLRYPASQSPVTIRFLELVTNRFLGERKFVTPGTYSGLTFGVITGLLAERIVNGVPLDANRHRGENEVPCKAPPSTTTSTTTPTTPTTPTVPPPATPPTTLPFRIGALSNACIKDAPFIILVSGDSPQFNGRTATVTFNTLGGTFVETHQVVFQANTEYRFVFPGAEVDPVTGEALDWPGWMKNADGFWVKDPSDAEFRLGMEVIVQVNPTSTATVSYPPESAICASPSGPFPPGPLPPLNSLPPGTLSPTR